MRQLRYLQAADDPKLLIVETADSGEQFGLRVDDALRDAVRTEAPAGGPPAPEAATAASLSPREIQMRVRAGTDPQDLADEHGLPLERIMRFAAPVVEERQRITEEARRARARRTTTDGQTVVFGDAVDDRFTAYGIDAGSVRWDARRRGDGHWRITATWLGGEGEHSAGWSFHLAARQVTPVDDTAADLLSDKPIRPLVPAGASAPPASRSPLGPGVVAFPAMPEAHTGPLPKLEEVFDQDAADPDAPRVGTPATATAPAAAAPRAPGAIRLAPAPLPPPAPPSLAFAPPLPLGIHDPLATAGAMSDQGTAPVAQLTSSNAGAPGDEHTDHPRRVRQRERSKVPTWDDIMLGVRRKQD